MAIAVLITAVPVFADDYDSMMSKAQSYRESGDIERALASYRLAERGQPERPDAYLGEAGLLLELGNVSEALEIVNSVLEKDSFLPEAWVLKCRIDIASGDAAALESDQLYAEICDADLQDLYPEIARFYFNAGNNSKAAEILGLIDTSDLPDDLREMYQPALTAAKQGAASGTTMDQAFDEDRLVLKKADLSEEIQGYEIDRSWFIEQGMAAPDNLEAIFQNMFNEGTIELYSLSPSGNSGIYCDNSDFGYAMYEGKIHAITASGDRGVADEYGNLETYANKERFKDLFGKEGVVYSHNGRYAAVYNFRKYFVNAWYFVDPILIDLSTGECFLTATYGNKPAKGHYGTVTTACFSSDDRYFYYLLYGNTTEYGTCVLYRYDMDSTATELCCVIPYFTYYPQLCEVADGSFIILEDNFTSSIMDSVVQITQTDGIWKVEKHDYSMPTKCWYPMQMVYSRHSDYAFMAGKFASSFDLAFMAFKPGEDYSGFNKYHAISKESQTVVDVNADTLQSYIQEGTTTDFSTVPYEAIYKYVLSPDGNYALILTKNPNGSDHLYMVRLETLELKEVRGLDPSSIQVEESGSDYQTIIEWNTGILIINTTEGVKAYEFDY